MKTLTKELSVAIISLFVFLNLQAQNQEELFIEQLNEQEAVDIQGSANCNLGDIFVTVKSDIPHLIFDSNVIDIKKNISYKADAHEYVFCHKKGSFFLTVSSPSHISKDIYVDGKSPKYAFKVVSKQPTGKIFFKTNPNNAYVDFNREGLSPQLTSSPIEMNAGEYKVRISKIGYLPLDTMVTISSDGSTKMMDINLKQDFAKIQLDVTAADNSPFQMYPVIDIDTAHINMADLFDNSKLRSFDDDGRLEYFKLYKGGYIPVPAGAYNIQINTPGFQTYSTIVRTIKGSTSPLVVKLQPITGFLTVIDGGNAAGATIMLDNQNIGTVPLFKYKVRAGTHKLEFVKQGFMSPEKEYKMITTEGEEEVIRMTMTVFKEYHVISEPTGAEILVNNKREGFTPATIFLREGKHEVTIRLIGYLDEVQNFTISNKGNNKPDTIRCNMQVSHPVFINSEAQGLNIIIKNKERILSTGNKTPAEIQLPYGKYKLILRDDEFKRFSGNFKHDGETSINAPCYSRGTFTTLVGDYFMNKSFESQDSISCKKEIKYGLLANAQFGRFNLFPGLSTSILRTSIFKVNENFKGQIIDAGKDKNDIKINTDNKKYDDYLFSGSCLLLNGEFRAGVSILKNLDVCALGTYVWYPRLTDFLPMSHVNGQEMFFGIELSSRISYLNVNMKLGKEIYKGNYNFYVNDRGNKSADKFYSEKFDFSGMVFTLGFTLGDHVSNGNNMLRVWDKPLISDY